MQFRPCKTRKALCRLFAVLLLCAALSAGAEAPFAGRTADYEYDYLPVYRSGPDTKRRIAITVDDCYQPENLARIAKWAHDAGGKLTIFPIGENLSRKNMDTILKKCALKWGFEIENHTWSHERVFRLPAEEMAAQIWKQDRGVDELLGVRYEQHFFRLMGGDGTTDQRTHSYLKQLGYKGIAEWSCSGSDSTDEEIKKALAPGAIYLFHTTDADAKKLKWFIPYATKQGYKLVTLNRLLGYDHNAVSKLSRDSEMPDPLPYRKDWRTHKAGDYAWDILCMQDKLREMGYLTMDGPSTGYYGEKTRDAIQAYQADHGLPADGVADPRTQKLLLDGEDAPEECD